MLDSTFIRKLRTRPKLILAFSFPMVLMAVVAAMVYAGLQRSTATARSVQHTQEVIARGRELGNLILGMETGERGFLLTGSHEFLEPFEESRLLWDERVADLVQLLRDNPDQVRRVRDIDALAKRWLAVAAGPEIAARSRVGLVSQPPAIETDEAKLVAGALAQVVSLVELRQGKRLMDALHAQLKTLLEVEAGLLQARVLATADCDATTARHAVLGTAAAIFLLLLTTVLVSNGMVARLDAIAEGAKELPSGRLSRRIAVHSQDEIGTLAGAFNQMADNILEQRAELEHIYATTPIGMCLLDKQLRFVRINRKLAELNGAAIPEHLGRSLSDMLPTMAGTLEPLCHRVLETGEAILGVEVKAVTPALPGAERDWTFNLYPHHGASGTLVGVATTVEDVTEKRAMERLQRRFLQEVLLAQESERTRLARELHDETGSALTSLAIGIRQVAKRSTDEASQAQLRRLQEQVDRTLDEVRRLAHGLHPLALEQLGLGPAIEQHALSCASSFGIEIKVRVAELPEMIPEHIASALYRVFQEALANILKHAHADAVTVLVDHREGELVMVVEDDGRGIETLDPADFATAGKLGLHGMRERVALLQGTLSIEPTPGGGTTLFVKVPIHETSHA